jgi:hypothetical protein
VIDENTDLVTLRQAANELAGDADRPEAVAQTWAKVTERRESARPSRRPLFTWLAVPAAAAAVVAVVLAAVVALKPGGGSGARPGSGAMKTITATPRLTVGITRPEVEVHVTDIGTVVKQVPLSQAVAAMVAAAPKAGRLVVPPGQFLYARTEVAQRGAGGKLETHVYEVWSDSNMVTVRILHDNVEFEIRSSAAQPNLEFPTQAYLASLPTDPSKLYALFAKLNSDVKFPGSQYVSKEVQFALSSYAPLLSTDLRIGYYKVMGLVPGGVAHQVKVGGQLYYGFEDMTAPQGGGDLLCDPTTGEVVGTRWGNDEIDMYHFAVVASMDDRG